MNATDYWAKEANLWDRLYKEEKSPTSFFLQKRRKAIVKLLPPLEKKHIIDLGCGNGEFGIFCAERGALVTFVDSSKAMTELTKTALRRKNLRGRVITKKIEDIPVREKFDLVFAIGLMDYVSNKEKAIEKCRQITKNQLIITFPKKYSPFALLRAKWMTPIRRKILKIPQIQNTFSKKEIKLLAEKHEFEIKRITTIWATMYICNMEVKNK